MTAVAFCPISPLLFRHLSGKADGAAGLRSEAVGTVRDALAGATAVTVLVPVGGREAPEAWWDPSGRVAGGRPLGTQVGEHLLELAGCTVPATYVECRDVTTPQLQPNDRSVPPGTVTTPQLQPNDGSAPPGTVTSPQLQPNDGSALAGAVTSPQLQPNDRSALPGAVTSPQLQPNDRSAPPGAVTTPQLQPNDRSAPPGTVTTPQLQPNDTTALLVLGDGSACRREGAPGYIDDRSFAYDDTVAAALGSGDTAALAGLDRSLGAELLATGRMTWPVAAAAITPASAELRYRDDPYGLSWFVALWR